VTYLIGERRLSGRGSLRISPHCLLAAAEQLVITLGIEEKGIRRSVRFMAGTAAAGFAYRLRTRPGALPSTPSQRPPGRLAAAARI
jgi:hypothetical protein